MQEVCVEIMRCLSQFTTFIMRLLCFQAITMIEGTKVMKV